MPITGGPVPLTVVFHFTGSSDVTAWLWNFGDGNTSALESPSNTYTVAGTYTVALTITSPAGTATIYDTVTADSDNIAWTQPSPAAAYTPGYNPQVMLRCSNDGGKTWGKELMRSSGKVGEYSRRLRWNRMGASRRRVFEVSVTDPVLWRITGAYLDSFVAGKEG